VIEQSLYFALGFLAATLLALAVLPAFWRRAYRLSRREIEATLPLSPKEIAAERDQLRAKAAVERVQLEQTVETVKAARQKAMVELGQRAVVIARLGDELNARDASIEALEARASGLDNSLAVANDALAETRSKLANTVAELAQLGEEYKALEGRRAVIEDTADQRRVEIAAHRTNLDAQRARIDELDTGLKATRLEARQRAEQLRETARLLREAEKDRAILSSRLEAAEEISEKRAAIIGERDARIEDLREKSAQLTRASKDMDAALKREARKAEQAEKALAEREASILKLREDARQTATDLTRSLEKLRADKQKLQADLTDARAKAAQLQREVNALKNAPEPMVSDLRSRSAVSK
jgi:chromosome segregation ATPase